MEWVIVIVLGVVGFGILLVTFATASKMAGHLRPYIGMALMFFNLCQHTAFTGAT